MSIEQKVMLVGDGTIEIEYSIENKIETGLENFHFEEEKKKMPPPVPSLSEYAYIFCMKLLTLSKFPATSFSRTTV